MANIFIMKRDIEIEEQCWKLQIYTVLKLHLLCSTNTKIGPKFAYPL